MSKAKNYFYQLDALRGIACLMVLFYHLVPGSGTWIALGPLGVRLFFVMTGFLLIGNHLQQLDRGSAPANILTSFYKKRAIRIFPVYFLAFGILCLFGIEPARQVWVWICTFSVNFYMGFTEQWPGALSHYWFLATSEQMVLVLSLLILWIPRRLFVPIFALCFVGAWLHRWIATALGVAPMMVWYSPLSSMDSIAAGALIGLFYREKKETISQLACRTSVALVAWCCLIGAAVIRLWGFDTAWIHSAETLEALFFGWLILRAAIGFTGFWGGALQFSGLVYTGVISYALYVFHPLIHTLVETTFEKLHFPSNPENVLLITTTFVVTFLAGILSWHFLEKPLISLKTKVAADKK